MFTHYFFVTAYVLSLIYSTCSLIHLIGKKFPIIVDAIREESSMEKGFKKDVSVAGTSFIILMAVVLLAMAIYLWVYLFDSIL
jgi:hypothetical protein